MDNIFYIYAWFRDDYGTPFYIGKGKGNRYKIIENRSKHFKNIYNSIPTHVVILQSDLTEEEAFQAEKDMIFYLIKVEKYSSDISEDKTPHNKTKHLVNKTWGGEGSCGFTFKQSKETIEKRVSKNKGKKRNEEQIEHLKNGQRKRFSNPDELKKHQERTRAIRKECIVSEETRKKISEQAKERYKNKENNPNYGNRWTDEQKENQRHRVIQKTRETIGRKIYCVELDKIFISISEANEYFKKYYNTPINKTQMRKLLSGESKKDWYKEIEINGVLTKLHWRDVTPATTE